MAVRDAAFASKLDRLIRIERPIADDSLDGAGSGQWLLVDEVYAEVQDVLPSRTIAPPPEPMPAAVRTSRVRIRYRSDIAAGMRVNFEGRIMKIAPGIAELGRREGLEFLAHEHLPAGNPA